MTVLSLNPDAGSDIQAHRPAWCGPREWVARVKLAACYRIFAHLGWTELIYNHITLRLPLEDGTSEMAARISSSTRSA